MSEIVTDLSVTANWIARRGFNNSFTLTFLNGASPFDISAYTFTAYIRKPGGDTNLVTLSQGVDITNNGAAGTLTVLLTAAKSQTIDAGGYYFEINYALSGVNYPLIHGIHNLLDQLNDQEATDSLTVNVTMGGTNVDVNVTLTGSQPTISTIASTATLTPGSYDAYEITAQAEALTIANPSTDYGNFITFAIRLKDNGTARALNFGNKYRAQASALPTTTTLGKVMIIMALRDSTADKYDTIFTEEI